ncbi:MAG: glycosyltransferase [Magnetococcales bacterium]|nr:glycosyltransferase [Magnetococcales bacterium]
METTPFPPPMHAPPPVISVVAPAYNEEEVIALFCQEVGRALEPLGFSYEIVIVENGSRDRTLDCLRALRAEDGRIHYVSLSRNFGHQGGLVAGLEQCRGEVVITMDADLQHPPRLLPEMIRLWRQGFEVVNTFRREDSHISRRRRWLNKVYYRTLSALSGLELSGGQTDFRLMSRLALNALLQMPERGKYLRGLAAWIGFRQTGLSYDVPPRPAGHTKFNFMDLLRFGLDGIFSFSVLPLRIFSILGLIISAVSLGHVVWSFGLWIYRELSGHPLPPGWFSLASGIFFIGGVQLLGIGLLGEYVGRIYNEVRRRPVYLVRENTLPPPGRPPS